MLESSWVILNHPGVILNQPGVILSHSGVILSNPWVILSHPESSWSHPESSWSHPESSWVILESSWVNLESSWSHHRFRWDHGWWSFYHAVPVIWGTNKTLQTLASNNSKGSNSKPRKHPCKSELIIYLDLRRARWSLFLNFSWTQTLNDIRVFRKYLIQIFKFSFCWKVFEIFKVCPRI